MEGEDKYKNINKNVQRGSMRLKHLSMAFMKVKKNYEGKSTE